MKPTSEKLLFTYELIACTHEIDHFCYGQDGNLMETNSKNGRILDVFFTVGNIKAQMLETKQTTYPFILSSSLGNIWVVIPDRYDYRDIYHVLGPVFTYNMSAKAIQERVNKFQIPLSWKRDFEKIISEIPSVPWTSMTQYIIMLYYTITGEKIQSSDFVYLGANTNQTATSMPQEGSSSLDSKQHVWQTEKELLDHVRNGNLNYKNTLSIASSVSSGVMSQIGDPLRHAKDSGITFCVLCARAAIDGGLDAETAYRLQNLYTENIENASTISDIVSINHQMYEDYIYRIHKLKSYDSVSPLTRNIISYIHNHIKDDIKLSELAAKYTYSEYYLSRKFKEDTHTSLSEYIRREKLAEAKNLLSGTNMSIQEIASALSFSSRNYFTDIFTKEEGISPSKYREEHSVL